MTTRRPARIPPRKILVPMDHSGAALNAWAQARVLGKKFNAEVEGLYVQPWLYSGLSVYSGLALPEPAQTEQAARKAFEGLKGKLGPKAVLYSVSGADVAASILSWAKKADLIVMGTGGKNGMERLIQGSVAEAVLRHSAAPVLVVREGAVDFSSVLAPVNFEPYAMESLLAAGAFAAALKAKLRVLTVIEGHVYGGDDFMKGPQELMAKAIAGLPETVRRSSRPVAQISFGSAAERIAEASKECGVVVLAAHRKSFLSDALFGTTVERVLRHAHSAVLAIPSQAAVGRPALRRDRVSSAG